MLREWEEAARASATDMKCPIGWGPVGWGVGRVLGSVVFPPDKQDLSAFQTASITFLGSLSLISEDSGPLHGGRARALDLLQGLPRVSLANLKPNPGSKKPERQPRGRRRGRKCGRGHKGERQRGTRPRLGFEGGQTPFYIRIPKYGFNEGHSFRRQYKPLSLNRLQYLIDLGRVDPTQPIDLTQLVNGRGVTIQPLKRDYGVQLVEEGADTFTAKVNIEVQLASELAIAAIEKNGGVVTTAFYDPRSLDIVCKPVPFFLRGQPIPKRMLPPEELVPYYTDAKNRGYLADPAKFPEARLELARKYGYILPD
ncbi:PREDICTED: LOW QUALITY PROTEIN: 39S ribosomal protein L15, mitochondrial-like, partial [Colobus angolensis palliatus]|uniref:LOW QUALITY PROTEIN: 39S ribosomal protein L15, mitochondrial-like n=1 Tax=Colobus angolensis palliatus TaxID=336983 RepID=UPI0005F56003